MLKEEESQARGTIVRTSYEQAAGDNYRTVGQLYRNALVRPLQLLRTQPIVQILAVFYAYLYGLMYLVLSTFSSLWRIQYHESVAISGLHYVALGSGYMLGSQICGFLADRIYRTLQKRNANGAGRPEFRVVLMLPASIAVPAGLFWYGWAAQTRCFWLIPDLGIALFAGGAMISFQCTTAYLYEAFTLYAASATAAVYILRGFTGFGFPLFGPRMFEVLGYGWGGSLLGFVGIILGIPAPIILWMYGQRLRGMSDYAVG